MSSTGHDSPHQTRRHNPGRHRDDTTGCGPARDNGEDSTTSNMDQQTMSDRDFAIQRIRMLVDEAPEIREDRVAEVKRAMQAGRLNLRGADLAEKLLDDILHTMDSEP
jgi:anti-sigma28 factor (negative regulator of flagellin synthesis)